MRKIAEYVLLLHFIIIAALLGSYADEVSNPCTDPVTPTNILLDGANHTDTTNSAVTAGDLVYGNNTPAWDDLAIGSSNQLLRVASGLPAWYTATLLDGAVISDTTSSAVTQGDIIIGNSTPAWDDLAKGTVGQVLTMNDAGTLPEWQTPDLGSPEGPPWGAVRHYAYQKFSQTSRTAAPTWGGSVADFTWTRDSAATGLGSTPTKAYIFVTNSTTTTTTSGYRFTVGSNTGYISFNNRPVVHYHFYVTDSAGTDSTKYVMSASMNNSANNGASDYSYALAINMGCTTGNNTITSLGTNLPGFVLACWSKAAQANVQACSSTEVIGAGNGTLVCVDTGVAAPASGTEIDIALDFLDSSNAKVWVNGVATTLSSNLPTANVRMVQKAIGMRTTAATTGLELVLENMEEWWD